MKPIPTLQQLRTSIAEDLQNKLDIPDDDLKKVLDAVCNTLAAQLKIIYLYISDVQKNLFPDTADVIEEGGELNRLGLIYLNRQPKPATDGKYIIELTGTAGSVIRSGLTYKSDDESENPGKLFISDTEYELTGSNDFLEIRSLESGLDSLLKVGDSLVITEPVFGVEQSVEISSVVELPISSESIEDYRRAIIDAIQLEPQGGSKTNYRLWAKDAQGVRDVYPYVKEGDSGVVQVFVEATKEDSTDGLGTPSASLIDDVIEVLELNPDITKPISERGRRPIQAILEVLPITLKPVDVEIISLNQSTIAIQSAIETNLEDYLTDIRPYIAGGQLSRDKNDILNIAKLQGVVRDTIDNTNYFLDFKMFVDGTEENNFIFSGSNIPYLRNIIYS